MKDATRNTGNSPLRRRKNFLVQYHTVKYFSTFRFLQRHRVSLMISNTGIVLTTRYLDTVIQCKCGFAA